MKNDRAWKALYISLLIIGIVGFFLAVERSNDRPSSHTLALIAGMPFMTGFAGLHIHNRKRGRSAAIVLLVLSALGFTLMETGYIMRPANDSVSTTGAIMMLIGMIGVRIQNWVSS